MGSWTTSSGQPFSAEASFNLCVGPSSGVFDPSTEVASEGGRLRDALMRRLGRGDALLSMAESDRTLDALRPRRSGVLGTEETVAAEPDAGNSGLV